MMAMPPSWSQMWSRWGGVHSQVLYGAVGMEAMASYGGFARLHGIFGIFSIPVIPKL